MASKRKRVVLSIITKHEIIRKLESGESAAKLAKIYGIGKATITGIKNQKDAIENYLMQADTLDIAVNRKSMMVPKYKNVDDAVFQWFLANKDKGVSISGPILCEKALEFNVKLNGNPNFKASSGWLEKFKSRHGIRELNVSGEKFSTDHSKDHITDHITNHITDDIADHITDDITDDNNTEDLPDNITEEHLTVDLHKFLIEKGYALQNMDNNGKRDIKCAALQQENGSSNATAYHQVPLLIIGKRKKVCSKYQ